MARQHDVWHYALWSLIQQSEILFAQGFLQTAWETQEKAFQLINEQHLEQLPMHEFLVRIRAQLLWALTSHRSQKVLVICAKAATALQLEQVLREREGIRAAVFHEGMSIIDHMKNMENGG